MKYIQIGVVAASLLLFAGVASAQTVAAPAGPVNVTTTPVTTGVVSGTPGTTFGTINVSGNGGGTYAISSIPITVVPGNGAQLSSLSNCQLFNSATGASISGGNAVNVLGTGTNTFNLSTPLQVSGATTTLSVRCDVASTATNGGTYQFIAGNPIFAPGLGIMVTTPASVPAGRAGALLALVTLDGTRSGTQTNVSAIPVTLTFNGASASEFSNCNLSNVTSLGTPLNTGTNAVGSLNTNGTATTIALNTPLAVTAGSAQILALSCDVSPVTPAGSTVTVAVDPATIAATNGSTGGGITPTGDFTPNGSIAPIIGTVEITAPGVTIPGVPNTGEGGNAPINLMILALSGLVVIAGSVFLLKRA